MAQWIRHRPPKPGIAGSSPAGGSRTFCVHEDHSYVTTASWSIVISQAPFDIPIDTVPLNTARHNSLEDSVPRQAWYACHTQDIVGHVVYGELNDVPRVS